ncbi:MAG: Tim44/TimA family putative adaptor protein [Geminicoccaceae bacterium]
MSESFAFIDIIFFAMVAAFIAFRLQERPRPPHRQRAPAGQPVLTPDQAAERESNDNVVPLPDRHAGQQVEEPNFADIGDPAIKQGVTEIRLADHRFDLDSFLQGAKAAFGIIIEAFANGDKAALRPLLADDVYASFAAAIDAREAAGERLSTEIVSIRSAEIAAAGMSGPYAKLTIRYLTEQINVTRDAGDNVVDGDPTRIAEVVDIWTFTRDTRTSDPNWQLTETRTPD